MVAKITSAELRLESSRMPSPAKYFARFILWILAAAVLIVLCMALWGSRLLMADDPPPGHVDAAIALQGSIAAEKVRIAGAVNLLRSGVADHILLSVPRESYWGQSVPSVARSYLERNYGSDVSAKIDFCETGPDVDSTRQEAQTVSTCIHERRWRAVVIVTSEYHTRRAGFLWRRAMPQPDTRNLGPRCGRPGVPNTVVARPSLRKNILDGVIETVVDGDRGKVVATSAS